MFAEIIEEPEQIVEEVTEEVEEIRFDETPTDYDSESHEMLRNAFKSIMPPDMLDSFAGFLSRPLFFFTSKVR
ncbi:hypothetical protein Hanom_Chr07g00616231 [Helianthus anomalus]